MGPTDSGVESRGTREESSSSESTVCEPLDSLSHEEFGSGSRRHTGPPCNCPATMSSTWEQGRAPDDEMTMTKFRLTETGLDPKIRKYRKWRFGMIAMGADGFRFSPDLGLARTLADGVLVAINMRQPELLECQQLLACCGYASTPLVVWV